MIKSCLKQIEPVDDEIVELDIKIKKGVLQNPEASGFWGMTDKEQDYETQIATQPGAKIPMALKGRKLSSRSLGHFVAGLHSWVTSSHASKSYKNQEVCTHDLLLISRINM